MKNKSSPKPQSVSTTYQERSVQKFKVALAAEFKLIKEKRKQLKDSLGEMRDSTIASANLCREIGLHLQTACNHEQINLVFWNNNDCGKQLGFSFEEAAKYIALTRKMPEKVKTLAQCAPFLQLIFNAGGMLELPEREEAQNRISVGPLQKFFGEVTIIRRDFEKAKRQMPPEHWSNSMRESFISDTQWIEDEREQIKKMMEAK